MHLVEELLDLFELFGREFAWMEVFDGAVEVLATGRA